MSSTPALTVDLSDAQAHLDELVMQVETGTEVILLRDTLPVARLVPVAAAGVARVAGAFRGAVWTSVDFDAPLPDEFWLGQE